MASSTWRRKNKFTALIVLVVLDQPSVCDSLVCDSRKGGEDLGLDHPPVDVCFGGSGAHDPVEGSVSDYVVGVPNMNAFGDDNLCLDDLPVGFCFEDEWIRELMNSIQEEPVHDSTMTNPGKRKFEAENSRVAKKVVLAAQFCCCTGQFTGHGVFEKHAPALLDNLIQIFTMGPFFVLLEVDIRCLPISKRSQFGDYEYMVLSSI
ncbi:hypothetical protein POM88_029567 [Heracleum sosnowskyi]|uniref:Uncharacterized protein n=1 Tax=Heracleum sosnowskyi TaxID=360622 RepID=A0AAD8HTX3_9APIA|nr:hypothetical protein POM88_029567 [Heracleum sosnowskyi]